jgi:hypothetical protein
MIFFKITINFVWGDFTGISGDGLRSLNTMPPVMRGKLRMRTMQL